MRVTSGFLTPQAAWWGGDRRGSVVRRSEVLVADPIRTHRRSSLVCLTTVVGCSVGGGAQVVDLPDRGELATYSRTAKTATG